MAYIGSSFNICLHPFNLLYSYKLSLIQIRKCCGEPFFQWTENRNIKWLKQMRGMRRKYKKYNSILKAVSYKASINMRIVAIADEKPIFAICFCTNCKFENAF
ncbi:hypothetical protein SS1G_01574 [Sclerotinia sclerotiorum 1980 UF-70]|uniref:Uncharacterized protein n=1 Tax=Sclerotinia sclerotiorum (strain ATCC 18683 / 1980 / Ss-1) TaxID=665079 RepID=A7E8E6_SCLS1|nr:hypothetical protein SS1G_01574 [Sclerotinia sclerotiorum 1980 UF-70]EDN96648.1 hypothetical protein SS1G_01574 [Sclerotinia sclerotiorum 1980 UF-70]